MLVISSKLCLRIIAPLAAFVGLTVGTAVCQIMAKPQVANLIAKVEIGVDNFRDYLKRRGENAQGRHTFSSTDR